MSKNYRNTTAVDDSSAGADDYRAKLDGRKDDPGLTGVILLVDDGQCLCGCGEKVREGSKFLPGHDARLKGILQRAHQRGDDVSIVDAGTIRSTDPATFAANLDWDRFIRAAEANKAKADARPGRSRGKGSVASRKASLDLMKAAARIVKPLGIKDSVTPDNAERIVAEGGLPVKVIVRGRTSVGIAKAELVKGDRVTVEYRTKDNKPATKVMELASLEVARS